MIQLTKGYELREADFETTSNSENRLYYDDSYLTEFQANLVEQFRKGGCFAVVLDQTAFYPTSGGQMHDLGTLNGQPVLEVLEEGDMVLHLLDNPLKENEITGKIDWYRRYIFMQQHTAFHILAQTFERFRVDTLSSYLGETKSTIEVRLKEFSWEKALEIEEYSNRIVFENRLVESTWVKHNQLESLNLRKFPPKMDRPIRLVSIKDFDLDPCGGTHVKTTGEAGMIKMLSWEKVRGNIRITFQAGWRALEDYQNRVITTQKIARNLSLTDPEMADEVIALKANLAEREKQLRKMAEDLLLFEAKEIVARWRKIKEDILQLGYEQKATQDLKFLSRVVSKEIPCVVIFHTNQDPITIIVACSKVDSPNLLPIISTLQQSMEVKGGGQSKFIEIHGVTKSNKLEVLQIIRDFLVSEETNND